MNRVASRLATELALDAGISPKEILLDHYASQGRIASDQAIFRQARLQLAFVGEQFFKDVAEAVGTDLASIVEFFKDSRVLRFFNKIGWSFKKFYEMLKRGYQAYKDLINAISEYLAKTKIGKWTTNELKKLDEWLKKNPKTRRLAGAGLAALVVYLWFYTAFTGDLDWDFDMTDIFGALAGNVGWSDVFGGAEGTKLLLALVSGAAFGLSFPFPGPTTVHFIGAVLVSLARWLKKKL
jgi:hypothetical protein